VDNSVETEEGNKFFVFFFFLEGANSEDEQYHTIKSCGEGANSEDEQYHTIKSCGDRRWTLMSKHGRECLRHCILRPAVTLTFDLQNLTRSSAAASEYFHSVS